MNASFLRARADVHLPFRRRAVRSSRAALLTLALAWLAASASSVAQTAPLGANVDDLLEYARANNPEIASLRHEADAASERIGPAGALPDPVLRVELENITNHGSDAAPSLWPSKVGDTKYTLMQALPAWGKRDLRRDVAVADAHQAEARATALWSDLSARIKIAYAQYYLAVGNERLTREVLDLVVRLERVAQARYAGGLAPQQDAIRAQLEQSAMRSELIGLESDQRTQRARLNALLARDPVAALAEPQSLRPLPPAGVLSGPALLARARSVNPKLFAEQARVESARKNQELTLRNRYPDITVGVSPTQTGSRVNTWGVMFEVNIPLQQAPRRSQEREALALLDAAQARADATANELAGELTQRLAALEAARQTESLIKTNLLPQADLSLRSALAAYENGKVDFATLLEAQRQIRKARQDLLKVQTEAQLQLAELERMVGEAL
ncbi:MAG TPA: TolC family protein [Caldimonas sp.]|nr:TolC family protein [Caldimonas sp.]